MLKRSLFIFVFTFFLGALNAQNQSYLFTHLSTVDGLSQSSAIVITQDRLGQIWIGTRDGLNKYDGTKFTVYRNQVGHPNSISNNDILSIQEDNDGCLWVGTYNGLNRYDPKTGKFTRYFHDQGPNALSNNTILSITMLSNGDVWTGTNSGLSIYNKETDSFTNYLNTFSRPARLRISSILETRSGEVYVGTGAGIFKTKLNIGSNIEFQMIEGSENFSVQDLEENFEGDLIIATQERGLLKFSLTLKAFSTYIDLKNEKGEIKNIRKLLYDDTGMLWVGTYNGIVILNKDKKVEFLNANIDNKMSLSKNSIKSLFKDKKGSIWVGTYYGGVNIWDSSNVNFRNITQNQRGKGLNYSVVSSIATYKEYLFFGTEGGGINIWDKKNNTFDYITESNSKLIDNNIKALKIFDYPRLWIGTFKSGLKIYDIEAKRFENIILPPKLKDILMNVGVYAIEKDKSNNIWIGTFGKGAIKYNPHTQVFQHIYNFDGIKNILSNNLMRTICVDIDNNVWLGTEKGLNKINTSGIVTNYFYDENLQYGEDILSIYQDTSNNIWVGTKSKGLYKYNGASFDNLELVVDGTRVSAVRSILEDEKQQLWISTNQGIVKYSYKDQRVKLYNQSDGLISNEFNDNASLKVGESQFFFGGPVGVTYIDANKLATNGYAPQVILTDFAIKENKKEKSEINRPFEYSLPFTKSVELKYNQGNFSISFSIPNFINNNNNKYKYRLNGLEKEWNITTSNTVSYTIQNAGNYVFEVKGANSDGIWNDRATQLKIKVNPAPWRSPWAFAVYFFAIGLALYGLLWIMRSKAKLKHDLELEHLEMQRAKEVNKAKLQFFTNISHEFRTPLALITGPLQQIINQYSGTNAIYKKLLVVESNANHLLKLINRLMDFRKFENSQFKLEAAEGNIVKFLHEIFLSFSEYAKDGGYNYQFKISDEEIQVYYDRYKLERVFYNLISNAFRYTPNGGDVVVQVKTENDNIIIEVKDSGVGIAEEHLDKIFDRFFEVAIHNRPEKNYNKGTGIGLSIANNIIKLHHGTISVRNKKAKGAIFRVELPLGKAHLSENEILKDFKLSDDVTQYVSQLDSDWVNLHTDIEDLEPKEKEYTILIVEDNEELRTFINDLLKSEYNILQAENGKVALQKALEYVPDLVISDVVMPEMVGTELCASIKNDLRTSHIPVILLTSRSSLIYKFEGLESGADDYISKPFNIKEFKLRIKNLLVSKQRIQDKFSKEDMLVPSDIAVTSIDEKLLKKAFKIVEDNIANEHFDIPIFCSELGVSRSLLFTKIKAWTNFTPNEFIHEIRLKRAAQLLEQNKINVSQICYKVGFRTPKYFSKCFQKKYGLTPSQFVEKFFDNSEV